MASTTITAPLLRARAPGLALSLGLAAIAALLGSWFPMIGGPVFGILIGLSLKQLLPLPATLRPGITFSSKQLLQYAIILLGAGLSLEQVLVTGSNSLVVMVSTLVACLLVARVAGKALGISSDLITLIGVGTSICGASAIAAVSPVIQAEENDVAYAISTIFLYNIAAVLLFPPLGHLLGLGQNAFGLWAGTAVNDTSSVVAAAYAYGPQAGSLATVVKLTRSTLIIPIAFSLAALRSVRTRQAGGPATRVRASRLVPWFIFGFLGASLLNTLGVLSAPVVQWTTATGKFLIVTALTAVGLSADFRQMARTGLRPILLGLVLWVTVAVTSLFAQHLAGQLG